MYKFKMRKKLTRKNENFEINQNSCLDANITQSFEAKCENDNV